MSENRLQRQLVLVEHHPYGPLVDRTAVEVWMLVVSETIISPWSSHSLLSFMYVQ